MSRTFIEQTEDQFGGIGWKVWCPVCQAPHLFDSTWDFNGRIFRPTFSPSMLVTYEADGAIHVCHSNLIDGYWEYFPDSTHEFAGKRIRIEGD